MGILINDLESLVLIIHKVACSSRTGLHDGICFFRVGMTIDFIIGVDKNLGLELCE